MWIGWWMKWKPSTGRSSIADLRRVLVVMPNWFGEALFTTPFLTALRAARPDAVIAALGVPRVQEILRHVPELDAVVVYDEAGAHRSLGAKWGLARALRRQRFDAAFILRPSASRTALAWLAGIPARVGFAHAKGGWLLTHRVLATEPVPSTLARACRRPRGRRPPDGGRHKSQTYLALLSGLGLEARPAPYRYQPTEAERREAAAWLHAQGLADGRRLLIVHPGANWWHKRWPPERFAQAADRLARATGGCIALTGAAEDLPLVERVQSRMATPPLILAGKTTVPQMAACLSHASLMLSNDTGVMHLAAAVGCPVVALYGPTAPAFVGPLGDPQRTRVLHHPDCCPEIPCAQPEHPGYPGMNAISVDEVSNAAQQLLGNAECGVRSAECKPSIPNSEFRIPNST